MSDRPRILFLAPRYPWPLDRGDRIRAWGLLKEFSPIADVTLVGLSETDPAGIDLGPYPELCARVEVLPHSPLRARANMLAAVAGSRPFQVAYYRNEVLEALVTRLARERFDVAFGQLFRMFPYVERFGGCRRIIDLTDSLRLNLRRAAPLKPGLRRVAFELERRRVERYEAEVARRVDEAWVVSEIDRADLLERAPEAAIRVIPNGVLDRWGPVGGTRADGRTVLWLGNLTVGHNIDMAAHLVRDIWPLVRAERPGAELLLAGDCRPGIRRRLAGPGVTVAGFVPDLAPLLARASVAVAPLRYGAGLQNKVLDTMAAGLPVVVSPIVQEPIGGTPGETLVVAETAAGFARAVSSLLATPERCRTIGEEGRRFVLERFAWAAAGQRMSELLAGPRPSGARATMPRHGASALSEPAAPGGE